MVEEYQRYISKLKVQLNALANLEGYLDELEKLKRPDISDNIRNTFSSLDTISDLTDSLERKLEKLKGDKIDPTIVKIINNMISEVNNLEGVEFLIKDIDTGEDEELIGAVDDIRKLATDSLDLRSFMEDAKKKASKESVLTLINEARAVIDGDYNSVKDFLLEIGQIIAEEGGSDQEGEYIEFVYNIADTITKLLFSSGADEDESSEEGYMERSMEKIRVYTRSFSLYNAVNPLQEKGFHLNKKEEESYKLGTKGTRGITTCGVCKMDNIIIYSAQKRGMDEGETIFNTCVDCGHKWVIR